MAAGRCDYRPHLGGAIAQTDVRSLGRNAVGAHQHAVGRGRGTPAVACDTARHRTDGSRRRRRCPPSRRHVSFTLKIFGVDLTADANLRHLSQRQPRREEILRRMWRYWEPMPASPRRATQLRHSVDARLPRGAAAHRCSGAASREASAPAATPEGERRQLTILFCDLVGSTPLSQQLDAEEWRDLVARYHLAASGAITRFGGHAVKYLGDGVLALFGHPQAHEDDAERAVRAGLAIVEEVKGVAADPLSVRVGIHTGATVIGRGAGDILDVFGESPNIAARVQALAEHDQVLITAATHRLVSGLFIVEEKGEQALKGVREPVALYRVVRPSGVRGRLAPARTLTPFVGRERELELLRERWEMAREGDGQVVTIAGEAGIGKSRLVQQLRSDISATPHTWIERNGSPLFANTPFHPIAELLRQFLGSGAGVELETIERAMDVLGLAPQETVPLVAPLIGIAVPPEYLEMALTPEQERRKLFSALVALVQRSAAMQPAVLVGEDLHWVDPSTLELIGLLVRAGSRRAHLCWCYGAPGIPRPVAGAIAPRAAHAQPAEPRARAHHVVRRGGAETRSGRRPRRRWWSRTDGVPLFVEELTRSVVRGRPLGPDDSRYLAGLADGAARPARGGARGDPDRRVIGREFGYDLVRRLCDGQRPEAWLDAALGKLAAADLVQVRGLAPDATYRFATRWCRRRRTSRC